MERAPGSRPSTTGNQILQLQVDVNLGYFPECLEKGSALPGTSKFLKMSYLEFLFYLILLPVFSGKWFAFRKQFADFPENLLHFHSRGKEDAFSVKERI